MRGRAPTMPHPHRLNLQTMKHRIATLWIALAGTLVGYGQPVQSSRLAQPVQPVQSSWAAQPEPTSLTQYVNPRIGTGGHGHVFLGANVPFGYVQLGPTEPTRGWDWCSGYHASDSVLIGFGHQHLSGTGIGDLGDIAFLPVANAQQRTALFHHANETVRPGYYAVKLQQPNVWVELTATQRAGFHRYTFGADTHRAMLLLDLAQGIGWDKATHYGVERVTATSLAGHRFSKGWANNQKVFFAAEFSQPVTVEPMDSGRWLITASDVSQPLLVKVGLSAVSVDNAEANRKAELPGWDFRNQVALADKAWNEALGRVTIKTSNLTQRRIFYTALYHTMTAPSVFSDVNGYYRGADGEVHHGSFTNYTTLSLWDTYRAAHPLMTLIHTDRLPDMAETFIHIYREQGKLPVWHLMGCETNCMVGNPAIPVLADMVLKGHVADREGAYEAMRQSALADERGLDLLKQYGYLPCDKEESRETVAKGLEYALADWCVAKVARLLGKKADARHFAQRALSYRKYFDPHTTFMRGVDSKGQFRVPFNPFSADHRMDDYTEGNAWQYTWLVPHDVHGLVKLFGGERAFTTKLDSLFVVTGDLGANASPDITGLIGQYAHGNEPSHHVLYLYNYVGQPWKGARLLRQTMTELYRDDPDGLCGNEDVGQMSAWYILSAMGIYQVEPAGGRYIIGSPLFDEATLKLPHGKSFSIRTLNNSAENIYVQGAKLNGRRYTKSYLLYDDIMRGGVLELQMGSQPSNWGTRPADRP